MLPSPVMCWSLLCIPPSVKHQAVQAPSANVTDSSSPHLRPDLRSVSFMLPYHTDLAQTHSQPGMDEALSATVFIGDINLSDQRPKNLCEDVFTTAGLDGRSDYVVCSDSVLSMFHRISFINFSSYHCSLQYPGSFFCHQPYNPREITAYLFYGT